MVYVNKLLSDMTVHWFVKCSYVLRDEAHKQHANGNYTAIEENHNVFVVEFA